MAVCRRVDVLGVSESDMPDYALGVRDRYVACGDMEGRSSADNLP
jgi:hypothetical protein